ncbi:hypothetical protein A374_04344 [Fictibacillus macauensis ZFHKF-1]|uniref:Uncharacterized protein n=1 Tax=Fictibacillus macauensis ZFHKF-1 TaxID=1196324 RepID=I8UIW6_9BACL|nr:DUF6501 family protein [Fictibacillus macauensis]EIT86773.1 hypothetical protein A374_04344 [Fictibacillus macauensis ZFHKF-1]
MMHKTWQAKQAVKKVTCVSTEAKKYMVHHMLTEGKSYDVQNETDEFYFVIDNSGRVGGYYKTYFVDA